MLVVSDNSPLSALVRIRCEEILQCLFQTVVIPSEVLREMSHPSAPAPVRSFINDPPKWLHVQDPMSMLSIPSLDPGEIAAISLAVELKVPLLIDERGGRRAAKTQGVEIVGVVGLLERAADLGFISDLADMHNQLLAHSFHVDESILAASLARHLANRLT